MEEIRVTPTKEIRVTLKEPIKKKVKEKANSFGIGESEYVRGLIIQDLKKYK